MSVTWNLLTVFSLPINHSCMLNYGLDAMHYFTAWDAALKMAKIKLELLQNCEMREFVEKGIRGGTSIITKRFGTANNPGCYETSNLCGC